MSSEGYVAVKHKKPYKYQENGLTVTRGSAWSAPGCHLGCGVLLYTDDNDRLVKVEGDTENPYNQGRLCVRCLAGTEVVNHPDRLRQPMKRNGQRGQDSWTQITWDEAYDTIEQKFNYYKQNFGPESVTFYQGTGRDIAAYISRLAWSFGSPNYIACLNALSCYGPRVYGFSSLTGSFWVGDYSQQFVDRYDNPEWKCPDLIIIWGNNPIVANSDGAFGHWVIDCMKRGSKILTVDPRCTWLAAKSEAWLQIRPGTDAALALAMAKVIIDEDLYDHDFVDRWCYGFDEYKERVSEYDLDKVSQITWLTKEQIIEAAHLLAAADGALVQWGVAADQRNDSLTGCQSIAALMMLTGNIDRPGGMIKPPELLMYLNGWGREFLPDEIDEKRLGLQDYPFYRAGVAVGAISKAIYTMETDDPYPLKVAWLQTVNLISCGASDPPRTLKAFKNLEFIVVVDVFMTPMAMALADIILPVTMYTERNGIRCGDGAQRGETINKVSDPGDTRSDQQICLELGKRFNPEAWPWDSVEEMFSTIFKPTGHTFEEVQEQAPLYLPFEYYKYEKGLLRADGQPGFPTPSGRAEFYSQIFADLGLDPLPYFEEDPMGPVAGAEFYQDYPLILITGSRRWNTFHSENRQLPHLRAIHSEPTIEINPETATKFGVTNGEWVWVEGPVGHDGKTARAKRIVEVTPTIDPRIASTEHGWWHPEGDPANLYDVMDLNINNLLSWENGKTGIGANFKSVPCKIYRVQDGE